MAKYIIDLVFDDRTGAVKLTIDFHDPSITQLELVEGIRSGEVREDVIDQVAAVFGDDLARRVRDGEIEMLCLDDHPELRDGSAAAPGQARGQDTGPQHADGQGDEQLV